MTDKIATIGDFLAAGDTEYQVFDLGRRLSEIPLDTFAAIEHQQQPHPYPLARHAHLAILFRHKKQPQHDYLWFLKFPLDERGLLNVAARDQYLEYVVSALGQQITDALTEEQEEQLKHNPYLFTPSETQRAALHAHISSQRQAAPSQYFDTTAEYLMGKHDDWQHIGVQGLHDCAARLMNLPQLAEAIAKGYTDYAPTVQRYLCEALEQHLIPAKLRDFFIEQLSHSDTTQALYALRALASVSDDKRLQKRLFEQLEQPLDANTLTVIGARLWPALQNDAVLGRYLQRIAALEQAWFQALFEDAVSLPELRPLVLRKIAQDELSADVKQQLLQLKAQQAS
ncbi:uncharacterized protein DUF3549 [Idiomarina fontislapidosi]|uniref:DUF3549 domain-containing protein n=1 Tax=Idiomarina fontislapidosi TaxID=263723 RepID=A0A432YBG1_9GAMM|nr:DUF3549 family protein [Idiomarina fontislapidosi]PYE35448.1 uncharacterized protein DUF3549 [Idiomarina fontislapidosi]RUO58330.1 DUF3549 domain-containing protein [Idiomarina fontislapidosi]